MHETTGGSARKVTTVHMGELASGRRLPPFLVYKKKHLYSSWTKGSVDARRENPTSSFIGKGFQTSPSAGTIFTRPCVLLPDNNNYTLDYIM